MLEDLKIGKNSQFAATGAVPARMFQEDATRNYFGFDTAQVSQDVTLVVTNISGVAQRFRASVVGRAVE